MHSQRVEHCVGAQEQFPLAVLRVLELKERIDAFDAHLLDEVFFQLVEGFVRKVTFWHPLFGLGDGLIHIHQRNLYADVGRSWLWQRLRLRLRWWLRRLLLRRKMLQQALLRLKR